VKARQQQADFVKKAELEEKIWIYSAVAQACEAPTPAEYAPLRDQTLFLDGFTDPVLHLLVERAGGQMVDDFNGDVSVLVNSSGRNEERPSDDYLLCLCRQQAIIKRDYLKQLLIVSEP
jgi:hypothetical protein